MDEYLIGSGYSVTVTVGNKVILSVEMRPPKRCYGIRKRIVEPFMLPVRQAYKYVCGWIFDETGKFIAEHHVTIMRYLALKRNRLICIPFQQHILPSEHNRIRFSHTMPETTLRISATLRLCVKTNPPPIRHRHNAKTRFKRRNECRGIGYGRIERT